jgi:hypothetical protein
MLDWTKVRVVRIWGLRWVTCRVNQHVLCDTMWGDFESGRSTYGVVLFKLLKTTYLAALRAPSTLETVAHQDVGNEFEIGCVPMESSRIKTVQYAFAYL